MRICSLLPSATEMVCALGLGDSLVGVSHTCDYPVEARSLPVLTSSLRNGGGRRGTPVHAISADGVAPPPSYALDVELLRRLQPDLILTQDLCDVCAIGSNTVIETAGRALGYAPDFLTIRAETVDDILRNLVAIGTAAGVSARAEALADRLHRRIEATRHRAENAGPPRRVLCIEWAAPLWVAGLWIADAVAIAGGEPGLNAPGQRSRKVTWGEAHSFGPDLVLLMPCGYDLARCHRELRRLDSRPEWRTLPAVQAGEVYVFDGRVPSRHGPRVVDVIEAFDELLLPGLFAPQWSGTLYEPADL